MCVRLQAKPWRAGDFQQSACAGPQKHDSVTRLQLARPHAPRAPPHFLRWPGLGSDRPSIASSPSRSGLTCEPLWPFPTSRPPPAPRPLFPAPLPKIVYRLPLPYLIMNAKPPLPPALPSPSARRRCPWLTGWTAVWRPHSPPTAACTWRWAARPTPDWGCRGGTAPAALVGQGRVGVGVGVGWGVGALLQVRQKEDRTSVCVCVCARLGLRRCVSTTWTWKVVGFSQPPPSAHIP